MPRPSKRAKLATGRAYHDSVPLDDNDVYYRVNAREETIRPVGYTLRTSTLDAGEHPLDGAWFQRDSWSPPDDRQLCLDADEALYNTLVDTHVMDIVEESVDSTANKRTRSEVSKRPHVVWNRLHRDTYLDELLRWSGRGDFIQGRQCLDCVARGVEEPGEPTYRCVECLQPDLLCQRCCIARHRYHPLHWIEQWTGDQFIRVSLKSIGLKVQLNHSSMKCSNPIPCHSNLRILHTNGIHEVAIDYCGCTRAIPQHLQLLRRRFYPASHLNVQTAASFELLRILHMFLLSTCASIYDFYGGIDKLTDNTTPTSSKSRYRALMRMMLQWRHLKMLMRGGRGHDLAGAKGTQPGELAVACPSCPRPGVNLPDGWEDAPPEMQFLYAMIICMDANFRLKNNLVSNYSQDPGLGNGLAYTVPRKDYEKYVLSQANEQDMSTCVGFQALAKANTKNSFGLRYTGVNMVVCGRSEMIMPLGVGNLQKGERYCNMDYVAGSVLHAVQALAVIISYDICCQWFINLFKRVEEQWPEQIKPNPKTKIYPAIPKLHEPTHDAGGHEVYSFNFIVGCGLTDGECIERMWALLNALASSTKAQGPGSRHDVLDDQMGFLNWLKYIAIGATLLRRYKAAIANRNLQVEGHRGLTASIADATVVRWEKMCTTWEKGGFPRKVKNPYETDGVEFSEADVRQKLAEEEKTRVLKGGVVLHKTSASSFLVMGLELEEAQRRLRRQAKKTPEDPTAYQGASLTEQRNQVRARIQAWEQLSPIYMPGLLQYREHLESQDPLASQSTNAEDIELWLPSRIPDAARSQVCRPRLPEMENELRTGQCRDALNSLRHILKIKTRMIEFKNKNVRGQRDGTRSRAVITRVHDKAKAFVSKYRAARAAKVNLVGEGVWEAELRVLNDEDVRGYQDPDRFRPPRPRQGIFEDGQVITEQADSLEDNYDEDAEGVSLYVEDRRRRDNTSETRRTLSWIWQSRVHTSDDDNDDILRAEWAKSRARSMRATEEVQLLKEEMRRVLEFLPWKARWWRDRVNHGRSSDVALNEALVSYAHTQVKIQDGLAARFRKIWESPLGLSPNGVGVEGDEGDGNGDDDDDDDDDYGEDEAESGEVPAESMAGNAMTAHSH